MLLRHYPRCRRLESLVGSPSRVSLRQRSRKAHADRLRVQYPIANPRNIQHSTGASARSLSLPWALGIGGIGDWTLASPPAAESRGVMTSSSRQGARIPRGHDTSRRTSAWRRCRAAACGLRPAPPPWCASRGCLRHR